MMISSRVGDQIPRIVAVCRLVGANEPQIAFIRMHGTIIHLEVLSCLRLFCVRIRQGLALLDADDELVFVLSQELDDRGTGESAVQDEGRCASADPKEVLDRFNHEQVLRVLLNRILQYLEVERQSTSFPCLFREHEDLPTVAEIREVDCDYIIA